MAIRRLLVGRWRRRGQGAVAVLAAVVFGGGVVLGMAAMVVDVGNLYHEQFQLQNGADAAALAVAQSCATGTGCDETTQLPRAKSYADANAKDSHTAVTALCGVWSGGSLDACPTSAPGLAECVGSPPAGNYVEVLVETEMPDGSTVLPPIFASAMAGNAAYKGTTVATCARESEQSAGCVAADQETYTHTFSGVYPTATATIKANYPLCPGQSQPVTLASYTTPYGSFDTPQYIYYWQSQAITATTSSLSFSVTVPNCYYQVDFVFRAQPINEIVQGGPLYGNDKIGSSSGLGAQSTGPEGWSHGGSADCDPWTDVQFVSKCDGSMQIQLADEIGANINAMYTISSGAGTQLVRVPIGTSTTVTLLAGYDSTVNVDDNNQADTTSFDTYTGQWTKPSGC